MKNSSDDDNLRLLIEPYEQNLKQNPRLFMIKFWQTLLLGYLTIFSIDLLLNVFFSSIGVAFVIFDEGLAFTQVFKILGSFFPFLAIYSLSGFNPFRKFLQPKGYEVTARDFPLLFAELDQLNQKQQVPRINKVLIDHSCNASVRLIPQFLFWGWHQHILTIGMNLLMITSPEQMRSILAHEWEHLSNKGNKLGARSHAIGWHLDFYIGILKKYKLLKLANKLEEYRLTLFIYARVSDRQSELHADLTAARLTDQKLVTETLLKLHVYDKWLNENYWIPVFDLIRVLPEPSIEPYQVLQAYLQTYHFGSDELAPKIKQALSQKTAPFDSHPALSERLAAFSILPEITQLPEISAAQGWFADNLDSLITDMDKHWQATYEKVWREHHKRHRADLVGA